jgi:hypothetical protein
MALVFSGLNSVGKIESTMPRVGGHVLPLEGFDESVPALAECPANQLRKRAAVFVAARVGSSRHIIADARHSRPGVCRPRRFQEALGTD